MTDRTEQWYHDDDAGPLVRLFAVTSGRARSTSTAFDMMAVVTANPVARLDPTHSPERLNLLRICRRRSQTVADIASEAKLPLSVVRVLLGDLLESGHILVSTPAQRSTLASRHILKEVIDGLRAL
jgi:hypothetical protein